LLTAQAIGFDVFCQFLTQKQRCICRKTCQSYKFVNFALWQRDMDFLLSRSNNSGPIARRQTFEEIPMSKIITALVMSGAMLMSSAAFADKMMKKDTMMKDGKMASKTMAKDKMGEMKKPAMMDDKTKMGEMKKDTMMKDKMHDGMKKDTMDKGMMKDAGMKKMDSMKKMK
jgi:pentapeptide MXKDX repeat protein